MKWLVLKKHFILKKSFEIIIFINTKKKPKIEPTGLTDTVPGF